MGSASELEYHLLLARDLAVLPAQEYEQLTAAGVERAARLNMLRSDVAVVIGMAYSGQECRLNQGAGVDGGISRTAIR